MFADGKITVLKQIPAVYRTKRIQFDFSRSVCSVVRVGVRWAVSIPNEIAVSDISSYLSLIRANHLFHCTYHLFRVFITTK